MLAIMGRSGSGKSTLLTLLGGVDVPTSGQVLLEGVDLATLTDDERTLVRRRRIGFVFQSFNLLPILTAEENVALPLELDGMPPTVAREKAGKMLELVGLEKRRNHLPGKLSGGEQQRVAIARALVIDPAIVLADEPTGNLDTANGKRIIAILRDLVDQHGQTLVLVTHDPGVAAHCRPGDLSGRRSGRSRGDQPGDPGPPPPRELGRGGFGASGIGANGMSLRRYTTRAMFQRPGRTILTLLSIVIGVAAAVAIDVGTATTRESYQKMFATVTGKATLEITAAGGVNFDEKLLDVVQKTPGVVAASPVVEKPTSLTIGEKQIRLQIMGIKPELDRAVREYDIVAGRQLASGDELVLDEEFARLIGVKLDDEVGIRTNRLKKEFVVVGLQKPRGAEVLRQASLAFMPIERAQLYFYPRGRTKRYDKIQIVTASDDVSIEKTRAALAAQMPAPASESDASSTWFAPRAART